MLSRKVCLFVVLALLLFGCKKDTDNAGSLTLLRVLVGSTEINLEGEVSSDLPIDRSITLVFSQAINQSSARSAIALVGEGEAIDFSLSFSSQGSSVTIFPSGVLNTNTIYTIEVSSDLEATDGARIVPQSVRFQTEQTDLRVISIEAGGESSGTSEVITNVPLALDMNIRFSAPLSEASLQNAISISGTGTVGIQLSLADNGQLLQLTSTEPLSYLSKYTLSISNALQGQGGEGFSGLSRTLFTTIDPTPKFPVIPDEELLTLVQRQTFRYFWDHAHPASGMARERNTSGDIVTSGGTGFGLMALIVGIERNFITRSQGVGRMESILDFLETADRFHGAWPHWMNGNTGAALPFSNDDNGGDLVETSLLMQGLLTFRQYLNASNPTEQQLIGRINALWESVEWDWYRRGGQEVLYWHWSPDKEWAMNLRIQGWNESLITYVLGAASPTHSIPASVYHEGWARNGNMRNGGSYEGIVLPLGTEYGGPLFFSHYSFLGIDPRSLGDRYADSYWAQNVNHTLINRNYCIRNPRNFVGYSDECWGLTASDNHQGYSAHSPTNDLGVITPTAALSSFPYTPEESMRALKFFYYTMGDRLWGDYGFYDAFNITEGWVASSNLAIDQGPIIIMIENHRSNLLWDLFMSSPEVKEGMKKLGFNGPSL